MKKKIVFVLALLSVIMWGVLLSGCSTNLQAKYVEAMEDTYDVVANDVETGSYKPSDASQAVLDGWKRNNTNARSVLDAEGKADTAAVDSSE